MFFKVLVSPQGFLSMMTFFFNLKDFGSIL